MPASAGQGRAPGRCGKSSAGRWASPGWRLYDLFLLVFGWIHGANGVRIVLDDYVHPQGWRLLAKSVLYVVTFILIVLGSYVIFTFRS